MIKVSLDREELIYCGRIDKRNPQKPEFIFPASALQFCFRGRKAVLEVENRNMYWDNYAGAVVDGEQKKWLLKKEGTTQIVLLEEAEDREHEILFFKRQDGCHEMTLCSLKLSENGMLLPPPSMPERKIEVYGDSVSAGEVSEAVEYTGREDPEHNGQYSNSWYSYAWMLARKLNARLHAIAQGGIALMDGTGWFREPEAIGMESIWDKLHYVPELGEVSDWDFSSYEPDVVIVAIGQNDRHPKDYMKKNIEGGEAFLWKERYRAFVERLQMKYPHACIICCTTLLQHEEAWDKAIGQICEELDDKRIRHYIFKRNGKGTPGHLRIPEAEEMAQELAVYIEQMEIEGWN